ncbi:tumor necrosis factor receptor superfamily member 14-like isoform X2 [Pungitius pungitius]|uniref:tumor necrosis factor receptor superfamily member 14-like isoform X2 n=1 Tax=Pungitius pungitius TaxID=134920 RepID=UPI002E11DE1B
MRSARRVFWAAVLCVSVLMAPGKCCLSKEYELRDGQCCPMCHEGSVVRRDCTPQSGTRCVPCVNGTFMNQPNGLTKCFPCSSCDQGRGLFVQQGCTSKSDTICDVITGYFCEALVDDKGCSLSRRHSGCGAGHMIKERGTRRTDTVCEPCPPGSFSLEGLNCTLWTTCSETKVQVKEGSPTSDAICAAASRHHYIIFVVILLMILLIGILVVLRFKGRNHPKNHQQRPESSGPCGEGPDG